MTYDLIIVGSGPAGLTASVYASRYRVNHLVIGELLGGLAGESHKICNFPSEIEIPGMELVQKMQKHAEHLGAEIVADKIIDITRKNDLFIAKTQNKKEFTSKTILLASGTERRKLNLKKEKEFLGKGLSYCATCDAMFYRGKTVAVIGGSDSATSAAVYLAKVAKKVYQIYRRAELRGEVAWIEQAKADPKIEIIYNTNLVELLGQEKLNAIKLDQAYKKQTEISVDGLFIEVGFEPNTVLADKLNLKLDEKYHIIVGPGQTASEDGIWAAGDITTNSNSFKQVITACAEGAVAAENIYKYLQLKINQQHAK